MAPKRAVARGTAKAITQDLPKAKAKAAAGNHLDQGAARPRRQLRRRETEENATTSGCGILAFSLMMGPSWGRLGTRSGPQGPENVVSESP